MTSWVIDWLRAFAVTLVAESFVAVPLLRGVESRRGRRLAVVALANLATHPLVWFLFPGLNLRYGARLGLSEIWAVVLEAAAYVVIWPGLGLRRAVLISVAANASSFVVGLGLRALHLL